MPRNRLDKLIEKGFWLILLSIASFGVSEIKNMSSSIQQLNISMATVIERISDQAGEIKEHSTRIRELELRK